MVKNHITIDEQSISYRVVRTGRRKTIGLEMTPGKDLIVRVPQKITLEQVVKILGDCSGWIKKKISVFQDVPDAACHRNFTSGDRFLYLGKWLSLEIFDAVTAEVVVHQKGSCLVLKSPIATNLPERKTEVKKALIGWYHRQARIVLDERVSIFAVEVGVPVPPIRITNAGKRWGSCGVGGRLNFPWRLVMAPLDVIDYVVVHELCHLKRRDHSPFFWELVSSVLPDFRERRKHLRLEGLLYDL